MAGARRRVPPRRQRRRPLRHRASAQGPRAEHHRHVQRARGDARQRRQADRVLLDRLDLRRGRRVPDAGGRAVPGADVALRRVEARRRGADRRPTARASASRAASSGSCRSSASATRTATSSTSTAACAPIRRGCACSATAGSASRTSTSRTASTRCCSAMAKTRGRGQHLQPRHRRVLRGERLDRLDLRAPRRVSPRSSYTGGERGWIGDNPFIFLDTAQDPRRSAGSRS